MCANISRAIWVKATTRKSFLQLIRSLLIFSDVSQDRKKWLHVNLASESRFIESASYEAVSADHVSMRPRRLAGKSHPTTCSLVVREIQ